MASAFNRLVRGVTQGVESWDLISLSARRSLDMQLPHRNELSHQVWLHSVGEAGLSARLSDAAPVCAEVLDIGFSARAGTPVLGGMYLQEVSASSSLHWTSHKPSDLLYKNDNSSRKNRRQSPWPTP